MSGGLHHYSLANRDKVYYLASPYSFNHENKDLESLGRELRYTFTSFIAAQLTKKGFNIIEPIGMCHQPGLRYDLPSGYEYWKDRDRKLIEHADGVIVLTMKGWRDSIGVSDELTHADGLRMPIYEVCINEFLDSDFLNQFMYREGLCHI